MTEALEPAVDWAPLSASAQERLQEVFARTSAAAETMTGYPCSQIFDYSELFPFLAYTMNNVGDPFADSNFRLNTHDIEREVIGRFATFCGATPEDTWGYVTSGGTEGNLYGLYLARERYPGGIVYFSEDTHYSVAKSLRLLGLSSLMIQALPSGEMDYEDLQESVRIHRNSPAIVFANIGTTMKGAVDDVSRIATILSEFHQGQSYIHGDAALSGMILPFVDAPPPWNFTAGVDSLSISGHKMLGSPLPSGIVLCKKDAVDRIARAVEYVGVLDTTLSGSRSAFTPLLLWYALERLGEAGLRQVVQRCLSVADYTVEAMERRQIPAWKNPHSITVVFPRPSDEVVRKWQIAPFREMGHLITMPHVTEEKVDAFISDYLARPSSGPVRCAVTSAGSHLSSGRVSILPDAEASHPSEGPGQ